MSRRLRAHSIVAALNYYATRVRASANLLSQRERIEPAENNRENRRDDFRSCREVNFRFNEFPVSWGKKKRERKEREKPRKEAISNRRSYVSAQFSFAPSNFPRVLFPFHSSGYILELTTSSGSSSVATLYFVRGFRSRMRRLPETVGGASASALEDAGRSSDGAARLGKLINLFIRRINIVTALRLARAAAATSPLLLTCLIGRPRPSPSPGESCPPAISTRGNSRVLRARGRVNR